MLGTFLGMLGLIALIAAFIAIILLEHRRWERSSERGDAVDRVAQKTPKRSQGAFRPLLILGKWFPKGPARLSTVVGALLAFLYIISVVLYIPILGSRNPTLLDVVVYASVSLVIAVFLFISPFIIMGVVYWIWLGFREDIRRRR
jgi:hypothetical protein